MYSNHSRLITIAERSIALFEKPDLTTLIVDSGNSERSEL